MPEGQIEPLNDSVQPLSTAGISTLYWDTRVLPLFAITLFLNAALLFSVQPMFSKMVLPLLGGTPAVWTTCMLFFQLTLLAGYLYAHLTTRWLSIRPQIGLHLALLALSLLSLPIAVGEGWRPGGWSSPVVWLIALLSVSLGVPFFVLSSGAPLLQRWFSHTGHSPSHDPYVLYSASNLGSMLALLAYPVLLEPNLRLAEQNWAWTATYALLLSLVATCAITLRKSGRPRLQIPGRAAELSPPGDGDNPGIAAPVSSKQRVRWTLLAFAPSSLLLGVTSFLTTDVAAVPLLWVIPLAIYLFTFVLVFARKPFPPHRFMLKAQPLCVLLLVVIMAHGLQAYHAVSVVIHLAAFFATAMVCHGELARSRPPVAALTEFYFWISVGGVLGGVFNVLIAPNVFKTVLEYPIALVIACALRPKLPDDADDTRSRRLDLTLPMALAGVIVAVSRIPSPSSLEPYAGFILFGTYALLYPALIRRPFRFALGMVAILVGMAVALGVDRTEVFTARSFFGVYKVRRSEGYQILYHGTTEHGRQGLTPADRREPLSYYHRKGPLGQMFGSLLQTQPSRRVAIIGLGTGSIACYGRPEEHWTFYEIDPLVQRIAADARYFTYLRDCPPVTDVVLGDARLSLATTPDGSYDLILLDAFSSDAIPVHLLTREALRLYLDKLADGGVLAFHISNRFLDLRPVLAELARDAGLVGAIGEDVTPSVREGLRDQRPSRWVVLSRAAPEIAALTNQRSWRSLPARAEVGVWTDDFSNIFSVFRWP